MAACSTAAPSAAAAELWQRAVQVYDQAQTSGAASKLETKAHVRHDGGVDFVLRVATALKAKPAGPPSDAQKAKEWCNPFLPYEEALWVQHLSPTHTLLLNKFNVVPHHLLVVTHEFESQQDPLKAADFEATLKVLEAMPQGGVAFYNCGEHSGRSQPHKHVQIVPLPFLDQDAAAATPAAPAPPTPPIQPLIDAAAEAAGCGPVQPFEVQSLPVRAYGAMLYPGLSGVQLQMLGEQLLHRCQKGVEGSVSYNIILTTTFIMYVPRSTEMAGPCAINALAFAGTLLLKSEDHLVYVEQQGPMQLLKAIGMEWNFQPVS